MNYFQPPTSIYMLMPSKVICLDQCQWVFLTPLAMCVQYVTFLMHIIVNNNKKYLLMCICVIRFLCVSPCVWCLPKRFWLSSWGDFLMIVTLCFLFLIICFDGNREPCRNWSEYLNGRDLPFLVIRILGLRNRERSFLIFVFLWNSKCQIRLGESQHFNV